jgi:hypothetical protein
VQVKATNFINKYIFNNNLLKGKKNKGGIESDLFSPKSPCKFFQFHLLSQRVSPLSLSLSLSVFLVQDNKTRIEKAKKKRKAAFK